jgi:hypothetical protein
VVDTAGRRRVRVAAVAFLALVAGCGSPAPATSPSADPSTSQEPSRASVRLACEGGTPFPSDLLVGSGLAETGSGLGAQALRAFLTSPEGQSFPQSGWAVVAEQPDRVEFLARNPTTDGWSAVTLVSQGDGFAVERAEDCVPSVVLGEELGVADWWLDPALPAPDPNDKLVHVIVRELACASGTPPTDRLEEPTILYEPDAILITIAVRERPGNQDCQGNPEVPLEISLVEPVGNRPLLDAGTWPPRDESAPSDS